MATEVLPDDRVLRSGRRQRALAQMAAHDLDVLVLGRSANVRYVTGTPQLWVAGTRPFGPACVLVRETGAIHLLSTWDEGVPDDIPHENLYGISWNPMTTMSVLRGIEGAATARRVGTDALSPVFAQLLPTAFPNAELVDGELAMRAARRIKTDEEVLALRESIAVAESESGRRRGRAAARSARTDARGRTAGGDGGRRREHPVEPGCRVGDLAGSPVADQPGRQRRSGEYRRPGGLFVGGAGRGYTGEVGRTWPVGAADGAAALYRRWDGLWARLIAACQPGAGAAELLAAYEAAGEPAPPMPVARGLGMGFDPPVVSKHLPADRGRRTTGAGHGAGRDGLRLGVGGRRAYSGARRC